MYRFLFGWRMHSYRQAKQKIELGKDGLMFSYKFEFLASGLQIDQVSSLPALSCNFFWMDELAVF